MLEFTDETLFNLSTEIGHWAQKRRFIVATAESCTAGGVSYWLTSTPGSSQWFTTGYVTYALSAKMSLLSVPADLLDQYGAVSAHCVKAMVSGACLQSGSDIAVAVSGIAGPDGGTVDLPIGTVWFAWGNSRQQRSVCHRFEGDRQSVRGQAIYIAMAGLLHDLKSLA